jgi:predicted Zn-dependent peptidase
MYQNYKLENGANVVLVPQGDTSSITVLIMYPVGSRYESFKLNGVSHYVEHLMFKGTEKRKNTLTLTREIDRLGAEYNAFTGKEYTGYYIKVDKSYIDTALDILSDMLINSKFDPKEMEREKGPIKEELRMYRDNPIMNIDNIFEELMFDGPLSWDIGGTVKHVDSYERDEVLKYRDKYYCPANMSIIVAGNVTDETKELVDKYFSVSSGKKPVKTYKPGVFGSAKKSDRIVVEHKSTDQAQLMLGWPSFAYGHADNPAVGVMNTILGGSMSSRLFIRVRERLGLAYTVRSGAETYRDIGYAYVRAGLEAKNINKAIRVVGEEIDKIINKGVTERELIDAKTHIRGALALSMEDSSVGANWYGRSALFDESLKTPEDRLSEIDTVTVKQVQAVAKKIFKKNQLRVAIIGDVKVEDIVF